MAVLVTRANPDGEATAAGLRKRGFSVLRAPMLRFEPLPFQDDAAANYSGIIVTSANALRAIETQLAGHRLLAMPLFAVGDRTAATARAIGFRKVISAKGDTTTLRDLVRAQLAAKRLRKGATLLYLAAADLSRDLAEELGEDGIAVITRITYRMVATSRLPAEVCEAFSANEISAVLHYSSRSARAFLDAIRAAGVEISALALPQCCISADVAAVLRDAGATQVVAAASPDEDALIDALARTTRPGPT